MQQQQKIFSVEEANSLVPEVSRAFGKIKDLSEKIRCAQTDINDLLNIWGDEVLDSSHVDNKLYEEKAGRVNDLCAAAQKIIAGIAGTGALVKDIDAGLIDFYAKNGDEIVFLCWKYGENEIKFWHPVNGGFAGRKSVSELKK